jgi:hypothetical protein
VPTPLLAVIVMTNVPPVPVAGVPPTVAVPFGPGVNVTPLGSDPVWLSVAVGVAMVVTVKVPAAPTVNVVLFALVNPGAVFTVSVKLWLAGVPIPLAAVRVMRYVPLVAAAGVPDTVAVPFELGVNVTPLGNAVPVSLNTGVGNPAVVTVNDPSEPMLNVVLLALVI